MAQSLVQNYIHIVFSTKNREHFIEDRFQEELFHYVASVCQTFECSPLKIGGHTDHVHILCMLSKKIALMELIKEIKVHSSKWMKSKDDCLWNFYWQDGYGAFSVNPAEVNKVITYIANQKIHHNGLPFKDEFRAFLKKYNVTYDERYVWD